VKSDAVKRGVERAPHRSLLYAVGCTRGLLLVLSIALARLFPDIYTCEILLRQLREGYGVEGAFPLRLILLRCVMVLL